MSAVAPKADMDHYGPDVRFLPKADIASFEWRFSSAWDREASLARATGASTMTPCTPP